MDWRDFKALNKELKSNDKSNYLKNFNIASIIVFMAFIIAIEFLMIVLLIIINNTF